MIVTPFGDLKPNDSVALARWIDAHARRHHVYQQLTGLPGGTLRGEINGDWFHRHWARHVALATFAGLDLSSMTQGLAVSEWGTEEGLAHWHELHNRIHLKADRQLKIV